MSHDPSGHQRAHLRFRLWVAFYRWARETIVGGVAGRGVAINAVSLAEICIGDADPVSVADRIRSGGVEILDVPVAAADVCATAYRQYRNRRLSRSEVPPPNMPLPDFLIGAHAKIMGWQLATTDRSRFRTYFPSVSLKCRNDQPPPLRLNRRGSFLTDGWTATAGFCE